VRPMHSGRLDCVIDGEVKKARIGGWLDNVFDADA